MKKKLLLLSALTAIAMSVFGQLNVENTQLSFGESLPNGLIKNHFLQHTEWTIKDLETQTIVHEGAGEDLYDLVFDNPGNYRISFDYVLIEGHGEECNHAVEQQALDVKVIGSKITYLTDQCIVSKELSGGDTFDNVTVTIPVLVSAIDGDKVEIPATFQISGVGVTATGILKDKSALPSGEHVLTYILSGQGAKGAYVTFDFVDLNGNIQAYYHLSPLK